MASFKLERVKEDFLTCIICTEAYTDPCTLACDHTFCRKCITQFTQTRPEAILSKTIPCAHCRQVTKVPDPTRPVEEWAKQIKPSIIIVGLIDTMEQGNYQTDNKRYRTCSLCEKIGETTHGTLWCQHCEDTLCDRCARLHHVNSATRDHEISDLTGGVKVRRKHKVMCQEHKEESVRFHCKDCKKPACQTCCIIYHRACKSVVTIESMVAVTVDVLSQKRKLMSKKLEIKTCKLQNLKERIEEVNQMDKQVQSQIRSATERAINNIKKKEKHLLSELKEITDKHSGQLHADVKTEEIEMQAYKQHCEFINQALQSSSEFDLFKAYMACELRIVQDGNTWTRNSSDMPEIDKIRFKHDANDVNHILDDLQLEKIDVTYQDGCGLMSSPVLYTTIDGKTESDKVVPGLADVTVLDVDGNQTTVVTDYKNKCVKSFYMKNRQHHQSKLQLDNSPYGLTQLTENQVMIAVPKASKIVRVKVTPDLVLVSTVKTSKVYGSVSFLGPSSLVAGGHPPSVDILSMEGEVLRSITTYSNEKVFDEPFSSYTTDKKIVVSDFKKETVICLTLEGDVLWKYNSTDDTDFVPYVVKVTGNGDILIANNKSKKVLQLTDSGQLVRDVLTSRDGIVDITGFHLHDDGKLSICDKGQIKEFIFA